MVKAHPLPTAKDPSPHKATGTAVREIVLETVLEPLARFYSDETVVEIRMVKAGEVIVDRRGEGKSRHPAPDLTLARVETICTTLSNRHGLKFNSDTHPKLSCVLPGKHRFECLLGASVQSGLSMAIRCKHPFDPTWEQIGVSEAIRDYILQAVDGLQNIIISGATNTGKTTVLNKMLDVLPEDRRVVVVEDTPELHIDRFWDSVGLLAEREKTNESGMLDYRQLYDHKMRITPDQIVFGEISTTNASAFLAALNSGAEGVMCSIHGNSPHQVIHRKFRQNVAWSGQSVPDIPELLMETVHAIIQIKRSPDGWRRITEIYEPLNDRFVLKDGKEVS